MNYNRSRTIDQTHLVWLSYDEANQGQAYITDSLRKINDSDAPPISSSFGNVIGNQLSVDTQVLAQSFAGEPIVHADFTWGDHTHLSEYALSSPVIAPGASNILTLYWQGLREADLKYDLFVHILDAQGQPITQLVEPIIKEDKLYYQNRIGLVPEQQLLWMGADVSPGLYLLRIGLRPASAYLLPVPRMRIRLRLPHFMFRLMAAILVSQKYNSKLFWGNKR